MPPHNSPTQSLPPGRQLLLHRVVPLRAPHAGGTLGYGGVTAPLGGGLGLDGQRVHVAAQLLTQRLIHQAVALYQREAIEARAHHQHTEVGLGARRHGVHVALVVDLQVLWLEGAGQLGSDGRLHGPPRGAGVHVRCGVGQGAG